MGVTPNPAAAGLQVVLDVGNLPAGQKVNASVLYPNGTSAGLGDRFMAVGGDGQTHATWAWAIPGGMTPGSATISIHVPCTGRNMDSTYGLQIQ